MTGKRWAWELPRSKIVRTKKFELKRRAVAAIGRAPDPAHRLRRALAEGDIATDLHVAKPTIYYYFKNKEEIVRELMTLSVATFMDRTDHPGDYPDAPGLTGAQAFERFIRRAVGVTSSDIGGCLFVLYPNQLPSEMRRDMEVIGQPVVSWAERIVRQGVADGSVRDCDPVLAALISRSATDFVAIPILMELHRGTLVNSLADAVVDLVMSGVRRVR